MPLTANNGTEIDFFLSSIFLGVQFAANTLGAGVLAKTAINMGFDVTGAAKQLAIKPVLLLIKKFINDDGMILKFVEEILLIVLNSLASPEEKLRLFVRGFFTCTGPKQNGHPKYHTGLFNCFVNKLVHIYKNTEGRKLAEIAEHILKISERLHAEFGNTTAPVKAKNFQTRFLEQIRPKNG